MYWGKRFDPKYQKASELRKKFITDNICKVQPNFYKTQVERDFAYLAKREYNFLVIGKSLAYSGLC